jgi:hypothetical protein
MFMSLGQGLNSFPFEKPKLWMNVITDQLVISHQSFGGQFLELIDEVPRFCPGWALPCRIEDNKEFVYIGEFD